MESKPKISFGFSKTQKKSNILTSQPSKDAKNIEYIKCVEEQEIKPTEEKFAAKEELLVIPLKDSTRTAAALASLRARHSVLNDIALNNTSEQTANSSITDTPTSLVNGTETLEQKAAREVLEAVRKDEEGEEANILSTVIVKPDELPLDGAKESTTDDYEKIPIKQFGYAMLRGMGWEGEVKSRKDPDFMEPSVRPKGMGLGADKIAAKKPLLVQPDSNETLEVRKNAYVRILAGKQKDLYGQIQGLDEHAGRVIVKLALGGQYESLNEFMVQPVSKKEYAQYGKVINSAKYEEYKKLENSQGQIVLKTPKDEKIEEENESREHKVRVKQEKCSLEGQHKLEDGKLTVKEEPLEKSSNSRSYSSESDSDNELRSRHRHKDKYKEEKSRKKDESRYRGDRDRHAESTARYRDDKYDKEARRERSDERNRYDEKKTRDERVKREDRRDDRNRSKDDKSERKSDKDRHREHKNKYKDTEDGYSDEKRHKKKTKKSKRPRSRSRDRRN